MRKRYKNDFYETPQKLTQTLLSHYPFIEGEILEPCAGNNAIASYLIEQGYKVRATDLVQGKDNDATQPQYWENLAKKPDWTVTNPPFNQAEKILEHSLNFSQLGVALLLRLSFLEPCKTRAELLKLSADNLATIIFINPRPKFRPDTKNGTDSVTVAWFVWWKEHSWKKLNLNCPFIFENSWNN